MFLDSLVSVLGNSIFRYPAALEYLHSRNVTDEEIKKYHLGYNKIINVPDDGSNEIKRFMEEMWKGKKLEEKIIFPVYDAIGRVVGVIGRPIGVKTFTTFFLDDTKTTGFFFGFYQALPHIYSSGKAFVVEGSFDCFSFSKVFPNTIATMTSGMYENQYDLLRFYADRIITVFDSDKAGDAGRSYVEKKHKVFNPNLEGQRIFNIDLGYKDPDRCLKVLGFERFKSLVLRKVNEIILF